MTRLYLLLFLLIPASAAGQFSGSNFSFLDVPSNAKLTALGGYVVSMPGLDINLVSSNPAQSTDSLDRMFSVSYLNYFADVNKFQFAYQHPVNEKLGSVFISVDHIAYGDIDEYDDTGVQTGQYRAGETMVLVGTSHQAGHFRLGGSLKFISSSIGGFSAGGLALDIGGTFIHPAKDFSAGLVFKNLGVLLYDYDEGAESEMPFDVQAGFTFKPRFMPFRFTFTAHHLTDWDNEDAMGPVGTGDEIFRHLNIGAELLLHKNVQLRFGYSHLRRQELKVEGNSGGAGFSYGIVFFVRSLSFAYSRGGYHAAGGAHNFTMIINTESIFKRKIKL